MTPMRLGWIHTFIFISFNFIFIPVFAGSLEDIKGKTGWQPRIHSEKLDSSGFAILRIDKYTGKEYWEGMKYREIAVTWESPQVDGVTVKLYVLLGKGDNIGGSVILAERTYDTTKGTHKCGTEIPSFTIKRIGNIKDCYAELWYEDKLVARKHGLARYTPAGFDDSYHWWEEKEVSESIGFYWRDPGLR